MELGYLTGTMTWSAFKPVVAGEKGSATLRAPRFAVQLIMFNPPFSPLNPGIVKNLSSRGAFIEAFPETGPKNSELLELEFGFPGGKRSYRVTARIVWARKPYEPIPTDEAGSGIGVHFMSFTQGSEEELLYDLIYWGEPRRAKGTHMDAFFHSLENRPGCLGMPRDSELVPYDPGFEDQEIDTALEQFMRNVLR